MARNKRVIPVKLPFVIHCPRRVEIRADDDDVFVLHLVRWSGLLLQKDIVEHFVLLHPPNPIVLLYTSLQVDKKIFYYKSQLYVFIHMSLHLAHINECTKHNIADGV